MITQERLKELLDYNPETGVFVWKVFRKAKAQAGTVAGSVYKNGGIYIAVDNKLYQAHRLAWLYSYGCIPEKFVDHIDGDRANNSLLNLRLATMTENNWNRKIPRDNTSGFKGVTKKGKRWGAQISINGKSKYIGTFDTPEEASEFYELVAETIRGDFHRKAA